MDESRFRRCLLLISISLCFLVSTSGCGSDTGAAPSDPAEDAGYGESCVTNVNCRVGLICDDGVCDFAGQTVEGEDCRLTGECAEGLYCDSSPEISEDGQVEPPSEWGTCRVAGDGVVGDECSRNGDCEPGLVCVPRGLSGICEESGTTDLGQPCEDIADCLAGLSCSPQLDGEGRVCQSGSAGLPQPYDGVECGDDDGPLRAYFEIPEGADGDFFRLPFPNDIRLVDGRPDLSGFPTPGDGVIGFDMVEQFLRAIEAGQEGFGLKPTVYFRFSGRVDFDTIVGSGENRTLHFRDITADSPTYDRGQSMSWRLNTATQRYICGNWFAVTNSWSRPLRANTTYAVVLAGDIRGTDGGSVERDGDFDALLGSDRPSGALGDAWDAYAPLRDWLDDVDDVNASEVLTAAVFTTGDPRARVENLREPARQASGGLSDIVACGEGATSVCGDDLPERQCSGEFDEFTELQGRMELPIFQVGQRPYLEDGGHIGTASGVPAPEGSEEVCTSIAVPKGAMPEEGWPLLIYAHGTGGNFRSHIAEVAPLVAQMDGDEATTGMVVLGWDQVQHGTRRGESELSPEPLVYNYANPAAARGNFLQSAADLFAIVAWAEEFELDAGTSPTDEEIRIDGSRIYVMGHSQGGTTAAITVPYEPSLQAAYLSGVGAGLSLSLLEKTSPVDARQGLQVALQDPDANATTHPVLSLIQGYYDPVDPHSFAPFVVARELEGRTGASHVFQSFGLGDTFTPPVTMEVLARGMGVDYLAPMMETIDGVETIEGRGAANISTGGVDYTGLGRQYDADGYDGHFVATRNEEARYDLRQFFATSILDEVGIPAVGE